MWEIWHDKKRVLSSSAKNCGYTDAQLANMKKAGYRQKESKKEEKAQLAGKDEDDVAAEYRFGERAGAYIVVEQVEIPIEGGTYIADFVRLYPDGHYDVVDAKGFKTPVYQLKRRAVKMRWGIEIKEV